MITRSSPAPNRGARTTRQTTKASGAGQCHPKRNCQYTKAATMPNRPSFHSANIATPTGRVS